MAIGSRRSSKLEVVPRRRRSKGVPFGRSDIGVPAGDLTDLGCPDCRGVLAVLEEGDQGHLNFTCRVGHAFSGETLLKAKEDQLEEALWSAVEVYEEIVLLHGEMALRARANRVRDIASSYERRSKRAVANMVRLRALISEDSAAQADRQNRKKS